LSNRGQKGRDGRGLLQMEANMHTTFNSAALAELSKSQLFTLLAEYRAKLDRAGESEAPMIRERIAAIRAALATHPAPR